MARQGIRNRDLAKAIGQSDTWVSRRLSPQVDYSIPLDLHDVAVIAEALQMDPGELFGVPA